jgi:hypothetical protein
MPCDGMDGWMDSTENWTFGLMGEILDLMKSCSPNNCLQCYKAKNAKEKTRVLI